MTFVVVIKSFVWLNKRSLGLFDCFHNSIKILSVKNIFWCNIFSLGMKRAQARMTQTGIGVWLYLLQFSCLVLRLYSRLVRVSYSSRWFADNFVLDLKAMQRRRRRRRKIRTRFVLCVIASLCVCSLSPNRISFRLVSSSINNGIRHLETVNWMVFRSTLAASIRTYAEHFLCFFFSTSLFSWHVLVFHHRFLGLSHRSHYIEHVLDVVELVSWMWMSFKRNNIFSLRWRLSSSWKHKALNRNRNEE